MKKTFTFVLVILISVVLIAPLYAQKGFDVKRKTESAKTHYQHPGIRMSPSNQQRSLQQPIPFQKIQMQDEHRVLYQQTPSQPGFITTSRNLAHAKANVRKDAVAGCFEYLQEIQHLTHIVRNEDFVIARRSTDQNNTSHFRMQQYYKGVPIHGAEVVVHVNQFGQGEAFNGRYLNIKELSVIPAISSNEAVQIASANIQASSSFRKMSELEAKLVQHVEPKGALCIYQQPDKVDAAPVLAYHVQYSPSVHDRWEYFIDASNGKVLHRINTTCFVDGPKTATAKDLNNVNRLINTYQKGSTFFMLDASRAMFDPGSSTLPDEPVGGILTVDLNNTFGDNQVIQHITTTTNSWSNTKAVSAHFNAGFAYSFYENTFSRVGIDGSGGTIISVINTPDEDGAALDNAFWNGKAMFYGNGNVGFKPLAGSIDVAGHEMTHGVVEHTANLEYEGESGAINESMADIFGSMMDPTDWLIGEDVVKTAVFPSGALRSLQDPHNGGTSLSDNGFQPSHMNEKYTGTQDNGGVHINSGIPNHAFFLFATATTRDKAAAVFYKALDDYLTKSSKFIDLRLAVIKAAGDLFGANSAEVTAARAAFDGVGINDGNGGDYTDNIGANPGTEFLLVYNTAPGADNTLYRVALDGSSESALSSNNFISRPSVTDDGVAAVYVGADHKIYVVVTHPDEDPQEFILDDRAIWSNAVISKAGNRLAAITDDIDQSIHIYDFVSETWQTFELYNPTYSEGINSGGPIYADAIEWDYSGEYLVYDCFNRIENNDGSDIEYWDVGFIHAWDKENQTFGTGEIRKLFSSLPAGVSIGNASFAKNSPYILAFDYVDETDETYAILGVNIETNEIDGIASNNTLGWPSFNKTDTRLAFTIDNGAGNYQTGYVALNANKISSPGTVTGLYNNTMWAVYFATGDRIIDEEITAVDEEEKSAVMDAYPNPFEGDITLKIDKPFVASTQIDIFNVLGKHIDGISVQQTAPNAVTLRTRDLPPGQYIIKLRNGNRQAVTKVVKTR